MELICKLQRGNFRESPTYTATIRAQVAKTKSCIHRTWNDIEPLFVQIRDWHEKLFKDLHGYKGLLAPICCLLQETLLWRFGLASSDIPNPSAVPWFLSEVCSRWWSISCSCLPYGQKTMFLNIEEIILHSSTCTFLFPSTYSYICLLRNSRITETWVSFISWHYIWSAGQC